MNLNCTLNSALSAGFLFPSQLNRSVINHKEVIVMQEVYDFLKQCGTYYLATVEGDQPRVRPFGTIDIF